MLEQYRAGENIASYCTKCKLSLDHTIVAMEGETIAKVKCKTCGSAHKFRSPADAPKARTPRVKAGSVPQQTAGARWAAAMAEGKGKEHEYSMSAKYSVGDIVNHDRFGKGIVLKLHSNKCDILFQDKERLMASTN
jgi:hypothetical protein